MGKQRTSRPQAFKATAAATSEMKAHVDEKNSTTADLLKFGAAAASETHFAFGELAELVGDYLNDRKAVIRTSQLVPIHGLPNLKLPREFAGHLGGRQANVRIPEK